MSLIGLSLTVLGLYSYYLVIKIGPGSVNDFPELRIKFLNEDDELLIDELIDENLNKLIESGAIKAPSNYYLKNTYMINSSGYLRYCNKCQVWKPDRSHHCSSCKKCQLKMDHHCPWFTTCIGFNNHKFFIQFLLYTVVFSIICGTTTGIILYDFIYNEVFLEVTFSLNWILMFIFGWAFTIAIGAFAGFSIYQILINKTTLETYDVTKYRINFDKIFDSYYKFSNKPNSNQYGNLFNLGNNAENWKSVMGNNYLEWILPIKNITNTNNNYYFKNGLCFVVNEDILKELIYNSRLQLQLATELNNYRMRRTNDENLKNSLETIV